MTHVVSTRPLVPHGSRREPTKILGSIKSELPSNVVAANEGTAAFKSPSGPSSNSEKQKHATAEQSKVSWSKLFWKTNTQAVAHKAPTIDDTAGAFLILMIAFV